MSSDVVAIVGNPTGSHWVLIVIDNRSTQGSAKKVVYFDSLRCSPQSVSSRCQYYIRLVNFYREHIKNVYNVPLTPVDFNTNTHGIVNGHSGRQSNAFDCGVFVLANLELYLAGYDPDTASQSKMPLYRASILARLLQFDRDKK